MTSEPGSFARSTIVERKPQIIRQVSANNGYPPDDAMPRDAESLLELLGTEGLGRRLEVHRAAGRLVFTDDPFWTRCLMFRQMPEGLADELSQRDYTTCEQTVRRDDV